MVFYEIVKDYRKKEGEQKGMIDGWYKFRDNGIRYLQCFCKVGEIQL